MSDANSIFDERGYKIRWSKRPENRDKHLESTRRWKAKQPKKKWVRVLRTNNFVFRRRVRQISRQIKVSEKLARGNNPWHRWSVRGLRSLQGHLTKLRRSTWKAWAQRKASSANRRRIGRIKPTRRQHANWNEWATYQNDYCRAKPRFDKLPQWTKWAQVKSSILYRRFNHDRVGKDAGQGAFESSSGLD